MEKRTVSIIAAFGKNRVIGNKNKLLWAISDDLKRFKKLTTGHPIIMGYKTFKSIRKPLPNRKNIVMSFDKNLKIDGVVVVNSLREAFKVAGGGEVFVIGGAQIYKIAIPFADRLYLTLIDDEKEGDVFFPDYNMFTKKTFEELHTSPDGCSYTWVNLER